VPTRKEFNCLSAVLTQRGPLVGPAAAGAASSASSTSANASWRHCRTHLFYASFGWSQVGQVA